MSNLQHERITELAAELRFGAMADLYGAIAQDAASRKDTSYADFLEQIAGGSDSNWTCPALVPIPVLVYAAFRSKASGLFPPRSRSHIGDDTLSFELLFGCDARIG